MSLEMARAYEERLLKRGYPGISLDPVAEALSGCRDVLDLGCGTGAFLIPLARRGFAVRGVEPNPGMRQVLAEKAAVEGLDPIPVHDGFWPAAEPEVAPADALLCTHAIYPMKSHFEAIAAMRRVAKKRVVIAIRMGPYANSLWAEAADVLGGGGGKLHARDLHKWLAQEKISYHARPVMETVMIPESELEGEVKPMLERLRLPAEWSGEALAFLQERLTPLGLPVRYRDEVFVIPAEGAF